MVLKFPTDYWSPLSTYLLNIFLVVSVKLKDSRIIQFGDLLINLFIGNWTDPLTVFKQMTEA